MVTIEQIHHSGSIPVREVALTRADDSKELAEAVLERIEFWIVAKMILSNEDAVVVVGFE